MKLRCDQHITYLHSRASRTIHALAREMPFRNLSKRRLPMNSFCKPQFNYFLLIWMCHSRENNYFLLIWMCHSRENNSKIKYFHERCLRILCNNKQSSFNELLEKDGSVSILERNLQVLATEMYNIRKSLSTLVMKNVFPINRNRFILR